MTSVHHISSFNNECNSFISFASLGRTLCVRAGRREGEDEGEAGEEAHRRPNLCDFAPVAASHVPFVASPYQVCERIDELMN